MDTNVIIDKLADIQGEVILEIAGNSPSRLVMIPNPHAGKKNGKIVLSDTACGVGVYVSAVEAPDKPPTGTGRLDVGDIILSVGEKQVNGPGHFAWLVASTRPGVIVPLRVARGQERLKVSLGVKRAQK